MQIENWFPTTIFYEDIAPSKEVYDNMLQYCKDFADIHREKNPKLSTGDVCGDYKLHKNPIFYWLNEQVSLNVREYMDVMGVDNSIVNIYAQKSWVVFCGSKYGYVEQHIHSNSAISVVYYIQSDISCGEEITFHSDSLVHETPYVYAKNNFLNFKTTSYKPIKNRMIIFPSNLEHSVSEYNSKSGIDRFSITYDIGVTVKTDNEIKRNDVEHMMLDPSDWKKL